MIHKDSDEAQRQQARMGVPEGIVYNLKISVHV